VLCLAWMSGNWHGNSPKPTLCKRGRGIAYLPWKTLVLQAGSWYRVSTQKTIAKHDILL
jgi:hypothetical protein